MREPAGDGAAKGVIGGALALLVGIGAIAARMGDDLGRVVGTGARLGGEVSAGTHLDDVVGLGDLAPNVSRLADDVNGASRIAVTAEGSLSDDAGQLLDLLSHGVDAASFAELGADGLATLDPHGSSGPPHLAWAAPSDDPGPQLVLLLPDRDPDAVVAACAAAGRWCVVEAFGVEERVAIIGRFQALERWWETTRPSDAAWVAEAGARTPPGAPAAWIRTGERWTLAHP